ncbi:MAG: tetratricopeptide repeat protein, partial [Gammaproteobacteria bacterium]|nr:tetratricopeptide repeat protein [Gammaproteobacteria bacterium]
PEHPYQLVAEQTTAMALLNLHHPEESEPLLRDIIVRSGRVNGPEGRDTLIARVQLGETLIDLRRYREAQAQIRPAAEILQRVEGPDNRYTNSAWSDYAQAACLGEDSAAGLPIAERVLATRTRTLTATDWRIMGSRAVLGLCLTGLGRYHEAEPLLSKAAADLEVARGAGFYATQLAYRALRRLYLRQGRADDAAQLESRIQR